MCRKATGTIYCPELYLKLKTAGVELYWRNFFMFDAFSHQASVAVLLAMGSLLSGAASFVPPAWHTVSERVVPIRPRWSVPPPTALYWKVVFGLLVVISRISSWRVGVLPRHVRTCLYR